jgi:hypothetical protein
MPGESDSVGAAPTGSERAPNPAGAVSWPGGGAAGATNGATDAAPAVGLGGAGCGCGLAVAAGDGARLLPADCAAVG